MPEVSVLIPAYNVEPYIRECLDSVLGQTMGDLEVICIDDASTDRTAEILREYERKDPRIRVYSQEKNKGQSCGRNLALSHASGRYIYMLDSDDMIRREALEELLEICKSQDLDAAGFETRFFTNDDELRKEASAKTIVYEERPVMNGRDGLIYCMEQDVFSLSVPTFIMKREYLEKIGIKFVEGILHEDVGYIFELISRADRIQFLHRELFLRRLRPHSTMTGGFSDKNIEGYLKSFVRSFELESMLKEKYRQDMVFQKAVQKWRRDIFGRIRQLYLQSEETIYFQEGGHVDEEIRRLFQIVKLTSSGKARARDILGEDLHVLVSSLSEGSGSEATQIYLCGTGQYAERMMDLAGAVDLVIRGVLVTEKDRNAFRGFPVIGIDREAALSDKEKEIPVILSVSRYKREEYEEKLEQAGYRYIIHVRF